MIQYFYLISKQQIDTMKNFYKSGNLKNSDTKHAMHIKCNLINNLENFKKLRKILKLNIHYYLNMLFVDKINKINLFKENEEL